MNELKLETWISTMLAKRLFIEDETFSEYIFQLCQDDTMDQEEKRSIIKEFLCEATENVILIKLHS